MEESIRKQHAMRREIQNTQYQMLQEVNRICKKNQITYYMAYGTLLGAVRHHATIPWDYDIDIAMKREDHNRFLSVASELNTNYELRHICYSSIEFASLSRIIKKSDGTHIDIFILDYAKARNGIEWKIRGGIGRFLQIAKLDDKEKSFLYERFAASKGKLRVVKLGDCLRKIVSGERLERWNYYLLVSRKPTGNLVIIEDPSRLLCESWFEQSVLMQYEDMKFLAPIDYEEALRVWYGDYMKIPPEGEKWMREELNWKTEDEMM